jgi:hypothetical protein
MGSVTQLLMAEDRSWFVVTEIDFAWTYVAGSHALIEALLAEPRLEVLPAQLSHKPFYDSDVLNAAVAGWAGQFGTGRGHPQESFRCHRPCWENKP